MLLLNGKQIMTERFPNNETKVKDLEDYIQKGQNNILEFKYIDDKSLSNLMFVKKRLDELEASCTLFVWYMPYTRMDRKIEGDLFTLQYVTDFINWLNFSEVFVMEPHSEKTMELLNNATAIYPVMDWLPIVQKKIGFTEKDHIVFPDKGAAARYANNKYSNICVMEKTRNPLTGDIQDMVLKEGKVNPGSKCIIIDDLCSKGGTFAWAASILKSKGASEVYLVVAHCEDAIFEGNLLTANSPITKVFTSKSIMNKFEFLDVDVTNYTN